MEHADTSGVTEQLEQLDPAIHALEAANTEENLRDFLKEPGAYDLAGHILGIPGRWLASRDRSRVAQQLHGWRDWIVGADLRDVMAGVLLAAAHRSRAQRRRRKFTDIVRQQLSSKVEQFDLKLMTRKAIRIDAFGGTRFFDFVIEDTEGPLGRFRRRCEV